MSGSSGERGNHKDIRKGAVRLGGWRGEGAEGSGGLGAAL